MNNNALLSEVHHQIVILGSEVTSGYENPSLVRLAFRK
jgi:hypothetical protein